jgi:hypothetical protein
VVPLSLALVFILLYNDDLSLLVGLSISLSLCVIYYSVSSHVRHKYSE